MKRAGVVILALALALVAQRQRRNAEGYFHTTVPAHLYSLTLSRPEARAVSATVVAGQDLEGYFTFGTRRTATARFTAGVPVTTVLDGLTPGTGHRYRFHCRVPGAPEFTASNEHRFHTARAPGQSFTFALQADSHLDENSAPELYERTLADILAGHPDFLIDLGDTFMTDKRPGDFRAALPQYLAQRYWFARIGHSVPLFLVLGNHDGEDGARREMAEWSYTQRTRYFPNPRRNGFYSGHPTLENYYAWHWGDALFIVLDPYWSTTRRTRGDLWRWTLGRTQYDWLKQTLEESRDRFRFVFIHHPIGAATEPVRGGIAAALHGEWGGRDADGAAGFATHRPGWAMPVHALLAKHAVAAVFHGHDHFYAHEELDGVVYQLVPQPANPRASLAAPRNAAEYGYTTGTRLGGAGHVRVRLTPQSAEVEYRVPGRADPAHAYRIAPVASAR